MRHEYHFGHDSPSIAVLITYHNEGPLVADCVESLLSKGHCPSEILVYDDASVRRPDCFLPRDARIEILRGDQRRGPSFGRNALLKAARSDYVHFHDADDLFCEGWITRVASAIREHEPDAVFTEVGSFDERGIKSRRVLGIDGLKQSGNLVRFCISGAMLVPAGTYLRHTILKLRGFREDLRQSEDYEFGIRLAFGGIRYSIIPETLVLIRDRPGSRSKRVSEVWADAFLILQELSNSCRNAYRQDIAAAAARCGSHLYQCGEIALARKAFRLARRVGSPSYDYGSPAYRIMAALTSPELAEMTSSAYRALIPTKARHLINSALGLKR